MQLLLLRDSMQGQNVRKLIVHKMTLLMVPPGSGNGLQTAVEAIRKPGNIGRVAHEANEWVKEAIAVMKTAPDNPYKDDEEIAGAILKAVEERQKR